MWCTRRTVQVAWGDANASGIKQANESTECPAGVVLSKHLFGKAAPDGNPVGVVQHMVNMCPSELPEVLAWVDLVTRFGGLR